MRYLIILSLLILSPAAAIAQNQQPTGTRINISAVAETTLPNDEVIITFRVENEGQQIAKVRRYVNNQSLAIKTTLEKLQGVKLKTISRTMQPVWHYPKNKPRVRSAWKMTQIEQIVSSELDEVADWLEVIEDKGALLNGLHYRLSRETSKKALDKLRLQAIESFQKEAKVMTRGIHGKSFKILHLNSSSPNQRPQQMEMPVMYRSNKAQDTAPSLSAGESHLSITVHGDIEVPFQDFQSK